MNKKLIEEKESREQYDAIIRSAIFGTDDNEKLKKKVKSKFTTNCIVIFFCGLLILFIPFMTSNVFGIGVSEITSFNGGTFPTMGSLSFLQVLFISQWLFDVLILMIMVLVVYLGIHLYDYLWDKSFKQAEEELEEEKEKSK